MSADDFNSLDPRNDGWIRAWVARENIRRFQEELRGDCNAERAALLNRLIAMELEALHGFQRRLS